MQRHPWFSHFDWQAPLNNSCTQYILNQQLSKARHKPPVGDEAAAGLQKHGEESELEEDWETRSSTRGRSRSHHSLSRPPPPLVAIAAAQAAAEAGAAGTPTNGDPMTTVLRLQRQQQQQELKQEQEQERARAAEALADAELRLNYAMEKHLQCTVEPIPTTDQQLFER